MKILITGGHLSPALAVIETYLKKGLPGDIIFVGRKYINEFEKTFSLEYREVTKRNIRFIPLRAGRFTRIFNFRSFLNLLYIPVGFFEAWQIIRKEKPDIIISFGSYLSLPIAVIGFFYKIPIFTHEQTISPGLANRIIGFLAKKVFLAFPEAKKFFDKNKVEVIGNPVREVIFTIKKETFLIKKDRPVIYITGGSLGSHAINNHVKNIIRPLLDKYIIIHQTGDTKQYHDYEDLLIIKEKLPKKLQSRYFLKKHFFDEELGYVFENADIVISRAGANTFFELLALKKPTIFIPLPWAANNEQYFHAQVFKKVGTGEIFNQNEDSLSLLQLIDKMIKEKDKYKKNFNCLKHLFKKDAAGYIIKEIFSTVFQQKKINP